MDKKQKRQSAIPFITISDIQQGDKQNVQFVFNPKALEVFSLPILKNKKLAIVSIAGPQRTGKSFLANRLLKRMDGFAIGPSTIPCTKGIWIWSDPVKVNEDVYMIIIDTQGLNSVQRDINIDIKIFSLSILLSSVFIYNSIGHIDEKALENMSLVLNLANSICVKKGADDQNQIGKFFPNFYWVLRDFSLDLKNKTEKQYLEECLAPYSKDQKDPKNIIRAKIKKFFPNRRCECFPRPLNDQNKLAHIQEEKFQDLRPVFIEKMKNFQKHLQSNMPIKIINGKAINADMFVALTYEYLNAINNGAIPQILTSLERVISTETRKVCEQMQSTYIQSMGKYMEEDKLPLDQADIETNHKHFLNVVSQKLEERLRALVDYPRIKELKKQLATALQKEFVAKIKYNNEKSELKCKELLQKFFSNYAFPDIKSVDSIAACLVQQRFEDYRKEIKQYFQKTKAPKKYIHFIERFPKFIFEYFDKLIERIKKVYNDQNVNLKVAVKMANEQVQRTKRIVKQQETLLHEKASEIQAIQIEKNELKRQYDILEQKYLCETDHYSNTTVEIEKNIDNKKKKITNLKNQNAELTETNAKLRTQLNAKKTQILTLQRRIKQLQMFPAESRQTEETAGELLGYLTDLKQKLAEMDDFYKKKLQEVNPEEKKSREIQQLRKDKLLAIERCREELRQKKQESRKQIEKLKEAYEERLKILRQHMDQINTRNMKLEEQLNNSPTRQSKLRSLLSDQKKLEQGLVLKQNNINSLQALVGQKEKQIKMMETVINDFRDRIAILNSQKANFHSFKSTFGFVLRESINWALKNPNKLKHSVKTLSQEDLQIIKDTFHELGMNPF